MSENTKPYDSGATQIQTIEAFRNKPFTRRFDDPEYIAPTALEVKSLIKFGGWSQAQAAKLVGVAYRAKKGSTAIRRWQTPEEDPEHRDIPYSALRLFLLHAGIVTFEEETAPAK